LSKQEGKRGIVGVVDDFLWFVLGWHWDWCWVYWGFSKHFLVMVVVLGGLDK